ncbi:MAG: OmpH family outer membrane protein, partial [Bacteroidia bacterium]|nr:OmpH family outer membrane protein [Bacteroidia bacterium]
GYDGELYKVQDDKIKPIQDKVYDAVEKVAQERKLDIILDKAANSGILFSNPAFDRTDDVVIKLGIQK